MSFSRKRAGLAQYGSVATESEVQYASPHRLVQMLMEGALDKVATAKGHMLRGELEGKSRHISWAMSIVNGLRSSLDPASGGEIATNLDDLYGYMLSRLIDANASNEVGILDEVTGLLIEIKGAWDAMPDEIKQKPPASGVSGGMQ